MKSGAVKVKRGRKGRPRAKNVSVHTCMDLIDEAHDLFCLAISFIITYGRL